TDGPYTTPGQNGGFLGPSAAPFVVLGDPNDDSFRGPGLPDEPERLADRHALLEALDRRPGRAPAGAGPYPHPPRGVSPLTSGAAGRGLWTGGERERIRGRYGRNRYGQSLLLAGRLVEAGVRLVTVYWGGKVNNPSPYWDTHINNNRRLKEELLPP